MEKLPKNPIFEKQLDKVLKQIRENSYWLSYENLKTLERIANKRKI